jgi:putative CocE/NonD family hydrolase
MSRAGLKVQWDVRIPLRDGIHLSAILYLPQHHSDPSPVIFTLTPYVAQTYHDRGVYFASRGYPFLTIDIRGRGNSQGVFALGPDDGKDGYDVVEWLARQPYCDGRVAMWGGSYAGYLQWATAREFPPHLSTIVPVAAPYRGVDSPLRYNHFALHRMQWLTLIAGHTLQDKIFADSIFWNQRFREWLESGTPFKALDHFLGHPSPIFQEWISHPQQDAYWDRCNPTPQEYSKLCMPILTITGSYDDDQPGALAHYREYMRSAPPEGRERHYLIIGPWDHAGTRTPQRQFCGLQCGPASLLDLGELHLEWYAWTLQGGPKPEFLQKPVAYYVLGAEEWRYADTLEGITARREPLYLQSNGNPTDVFKSGSLAAKPPLQNEPDHYVYDPRDVSLAALESTIDPACLTDQSMIHAAIGRQLVYHSALFERDAEISGFFKLAVWLSIDQPDTDFCASIYEIAADGGSILLTTDTLRARYRESLRAEKLICTQEPLRYDFERFLFVSRLIEKGQRLRLVIGPLHSIHWQKSYNSGKPVSEESMRDARAVTVRLLHDERYPSALYVPYG